MAQLARCALAEFIGTTFLLAAVVGSGIMGAKLSAGNEAIALLANSIATGGALVALIASLGPVSGAHFNPAVTVFEFLGGRLTPHAIAVYIVAQLLGAVTGVLLAHAMFELPLVQVSSHSRASWGEQIAEVVAMFGLLLTIWGVARSRTENVPYAVAAYIVGAYWFTSSTSFANPAVTLARSLTDTYAGIAPDSIIGFIVAQLLGTFAALGATFLMGGKATGLSAHKTNTSRAL